MSTPDYRNDGRAEEDSRRAISLSFGGEAAAPDDQALVPPSTVKNLGVAEGDLPTDTDTAALASFYTTVLYGLSIRARDGASHTELTRSIDCAMAAWPESATHAPPHPSDRACAVTDSHVP